MKMLMTSVSLQGPSEVFWPHFHMSILLKIFACMKSNQLIKMDVVKINLDYFFSSSVKAF